MRQPVASPTHALNLHQKNENQQQNIRDESLQLNHKVYIGDRNAIHLRSTHKELWLRTHTKILFGLPIIWYMYSFDQELSYHIDLDPKMTLVGTWCLLRAVWLIV